MQWNRVLRLVADGAGPWPLAFRLARRELRGGLRGFRIFLVCLMLGVATIAAVGSVAAAVSAGIAANARALLGGDVELRQLYRPASDEQRRFLAVAGKLSETRELRAMARRSRDASGNERILVELKAVDGAYPLAGAVQIEPQQQLATALAERDGVWGAVADVNLLQRLGLTIGDRVRVGAVDYELRGTIAREPDRGADVFTLGPRLMVTLDGLAATELEQPGSLIYHHYRVVLSPGLDAEDWTDALKQRFPDAGWRIRGLDRAAPGVERFVERTALFLTLVGLSALLVGGVGVGNAVRSYLDGKTATIATLKCLGAPGRLVFGTYLTLIMLLASAGTLAGLSLGALAPLAVGGLLARHFALDIALSVHPLPLLTAAAFGLLTALGFSLWPLARARDIPAAGLFRDVVDRVRRRPRGADLATMAVVGALLAGLAVATASDRQLAALFVGGAVATLVVFRFAAAAAMALARRANGDAARQRPPALRLALANLYRPGAPTGSVVLSLGLGLTVLVAVALIQANLGRQIEQTLPRTAPSFYFIDIQPAQALAFDALVSATPGVSRLQRVPMLRGRITAMNGVPVDRLATPADQAWVLRGDRGITWSTTPPPGSRVVAGEWWAADYRGAPLISLDAEVAAGFGLKLGDSITVNVLGREFTGSIASLRTLDWTTLAINFVMVFSPGLLDSAPQTHIATVHAEAAAEPGLQAAVTDRFANVSAIRVKDALEAVNGILGAIGAAVSVTGSVTLLAGILVLAGAVVAGHHRRVYDAVVLKVLGATRPVIARAFLLEYGLLGLWTAAIAAAIGSAASWFVVTRLLEGDWVLLPGVVAAIALLGTAITLAVGFAGTWHALGRPAAPLLRNQ